MNGAKMMWKNTTKKTSNLVVNDAVRQIGGRVVSALFGFFVISIISPYLWVLRYGDYSTVLKFFAMWSALADFGLYIIAVRDMGAIKNKEDIQKDPGVVKQQTGTNPGVNKRKALEQLFGKYVGTRLINIAIVYSCALVLGYLLPAYTSNPYLVWGLPLGMLFSASFMTSWILQLPLQLYRRMKDLTIGLILARVSQFSILLLTVFVLFPQVDFSTTSWEPVSTNSIIAFCLILFSVVASALTQWIYVFKKGAKYLKLKIIYDRSFAKNIFKTNRKYGASYFFSSFHILIVLFFLSVFFPSSEGYNYIGIWALGLMLIEIFLIIPSALGNSLLHSIGNKTLKEKKISFGSLMNLSIWIWGLILANFTLFSSNAIQLIWGTKYLEATIWTIGSDTILPYLWIILLLSFIKQVFNYIFISTNIHNKLLKINLFGVVIGTILGLLLIPKRGLGLGLIGGVITQGVLEILFVLGAIYIARKHNKLPTIRRKYLGISAVVLIAWTLFTKLFIPIPAGRDQPVKLILIWLIINGLMIWASLPLIKRTVKTLNG